VAQWLRYCATSRTVPGSIPHDITGDFFCGSSRRNHVPWIRLRPWKWVLGISSGVKTAGACGWRPTIIVVPNVKKIRGLNLPGTPWATSACFGWPLRLLSVLSTKCCQHMPDHQLLHSTPLYHLAYAYFCQTPLLRISYSFWSSDFASRYQILQTFTSLCRGTRMTLPICKNRRQEKHFCSKSYSTLTTEP